MRHRRNYHILVAISFLQGLVFYAPVATLYRQAHGLSLASLFLIESISWVLTLLLEVPLGRFADRFGCRLTIVLGSLVYFASKVEFSLASGFALFLVERVLLAFSCACLSGASEALLYASVGPEEPERRFGLWNAASTAGLLAASLSSPLLYGAALRPTAYATAVAYGLAALLSLFLEEPDGGPRDGSGAEGPEGASRSGPGPRRRSDFKTAAAALFADKPLLRFLLALSIMSECAQAATVFLSQPQYRRAGIGEPSYGLLYALLQCAALAGAGAGKLSERWGRRAVLTALAGLECGALALLGGSSSAWATVAAMLALSAASALARPLSTSVQVERIRHSDRATALSLNAMAGEIVAAILNAAEGQAAQRSLALGFWAGAGLLGLVLALSPLLFEAANARGQAPRRR